MRRVLLINTNTTRSVTEFIERQARAAVGDAVQWKAVTAPFGAPYVTTEAGYAVAGHAALDCLEREGAGCDAVWLACFGDPGLFALREVAKVPVVGMAEASMREAARRGRYSIVTGGAAWGPILRRLAQALELDRELARVRTPPQASPELARAPELILEEVRKAADEDAAQSVIIGGAALAGVAATLQAQSPLPLIDSVECSARAAAKACSST